MIRHFQKGDLEKIKLQSEQKNEDSQQWHLFDDEDTIVFADGDKVLAIVRPFFESGQRVWLSALIGVDCGYKAVAMFKQMKRIIDGFLQEGEAQRVEMVTQADFAVANRLAGMLGFECEGTMKKYFNGIDFNLWGRTE